MKPKKTQAESVDGGFTQVPNSVIKDAKLSAQSRLLYSLLLSYAWDKNLCYPSQERLAKEIGFSARQVRNLLKELEKAGYIKIIRGGYESTNVYILKYLPPSKQNRKRYNELFSKREE